MGVSTFRASEELMEEFEMVARVDQQSISEAMRAALVAYVKARRADPEFQRRLRKHMADNQVLLERLKDG